MTCNPHVCTPSPFAESSCHDSTQCPPSTPSRPPAVAPMSKWNKDALICLERDLKVNLSLEELMDLLERPAGGFMTEAEKMSVCEEVKQRDKVGRIISLLRGKGDRDFDSFLKLLRESGNEVWSGQLEEKAGQLRREALGGGWSSGWSWVVCLMHAHTCTVSTLWCAPPLPPPWVVSLLTLWGCTNRQQSSNTLAHCSTSHMVTWYGTLVQC